MFSATIITKLHWVTTRKIDQRRDVICVQPAEWIMLMCNATRPNVGLNNYVNINAFPVCFNGSIFV